MICKITSLSKTAVYENVQSIVLPALSGQMQILSGHAESFILLQKGNIILRQLQKPDETLKIMNGECYFKKDVATVIL